VVLEGVFELCDQSCSKALVEGFITGIAHGKTWMAEQRTPQTLNPFESRQGNRHAGECPVHAGIPCFVRGSADRERLGLVYACHALDSCLVDRHRPGRSNGAGHFMCHNFVTNGV